MDGPSKDELRSWIHHSELSSRIHYRGGNPIASPYYNHSVCSFIFQLCEQLKTPDGVASKTIEYYNRYMHSSLVKTLDFPLQLTVKLPFSDRKREFVRLIAILQIATKIVYRHKILKLAEAQKILRKFGYASEGEEVLSVELKAVYTLQSCLNLRTLEDCVDYLATLLETPLTDSQLALKTDLLFFSYCAMPYLVHCFCKLRLHVDSEFKFLLFLGSVIILSVLLLSCKSDDLTHLLQVLKVFVSFESSDILQFVYLVLKVI
ncbi:unnamed protein product [Calicophoron daubneyi]|uniref:Cyclin N-terminal domain-containing protein n=1 Tax=Calicophoron daubneyi TaxID=300641 RepID=A0AAV2TPT9_CALDB